MGQRKTVTQSEQGWKSCDATHEATLSIGHHQIGDPALATEKDFFIEAC